MAIQFGGKQLDFRNPGLLETFEYIGYWWKPNDPENKVFGTLTFDSDDRVRLSLVGSFVNERELITADSRSDPTIHGQTETGLAISLFESTISKSQLRIPGIVGVEYVSRFALCGMWIDELEKALFQVCEFRFTNMEEWLAEQPFSSPKMARSERLELDLSVRSSVAAAFPLDTIRGVLTTSAWYGTSDEVPRALGINFRSFCSIKFEEPLSIESYLARINELKNLASLCIGAPTFLDRVCFRAIISNNQNTDTGNSVLIYFSQNPKPTLLKENRIFQCLSLIDITNDNNIAIDTWFRFYEAARPCLDLFFGVWHEGLYLDVRFLLLAQSIEVFHRATQIGTYIDIDEFEELLSIILGKVPSDTPPNIRDRISGILKYANEFSLRKRLKDIRKNSKLLKTNDFNLLDNKLIEDIVANRNYRTHYEKDENQEIADGIELFDLTERLKFIIVVLLFEQLGTNAHWLADKFRNHNKYYRYMKQ